MLEQHIHYYNTHSITQAISQSVKSSAVSEGGYLAHKRLGSTLWAVTIFKKAPAAQQFSAEAFVYVFFWGKAD